MPPTPPTPGQQDTIKVRCQAQGVPARTVLKSFAGLTPSVLAAQLFAGAGQAALASILVGAVHFMSFCSAKRAVAAHLEEREAQRARARGGAPSGGAGGQGGIGQAEGAPQRHHLAVSHGASGSHFTPVDFVEPEVEGAAAAGSGCKGGGSGCGGSGHAGAHGASSSSSSSSSISMTSNLVGCGAALLHFSCQGCSSCGAARCGAPQSAGLPLGPYLAASSDGRPAAPIQTPN
jgi:hypothetical protein